MVSRGKYSAKPPLRASLMERLRAPLCPLSPGDPRVAEATNESHRGVDLEAFTQSLAMEVEALLNTRRPLRAEDDEGPEATQGENILSYGMPELGPGGLSQSDPEALCKALVQVLRRFEPRLHRVVVTPLADATRGPLQIQITGELRLAPKPLPITFDTHLDPLKHAFEVGELE